MRTRKKADYILKTFFKINNNYLKYYVWAIGVRAISFWTNTHLWVFWKIYSSRLETILNFRERLKTKVLDTHNIGFTLRLVAFSKIILCVLSSLKLSVKQIASNLANKNREWDWIICRWNLHTCRSWNGSHSTVLSLGSGKTYRFLSIYKNIRKK